MSKMAIDTTTVIDTTSLTVIQVPKNVDFDFDALIDEFSYDNIKAQKVKGHIIVRNGILSIREAGMNILNGTISMNADYDTRDTLKPVMKADFDMQNIGVKDAFNTFNTVQKLAPAAKGIDGKINAKLAYVSLLGSDMMPIINSINGNGKLQSDAITLVESKTFDKIKETLKLGDKYGNTFKNINISFKIADGRIFVSPFDVKTGSMKMNVSGDQGLDQTLNYLVKTEIPRSDLGSSVNSLIDNLSAKASEFGIKYTPSDILKVNVKVTGTFSKPIVAPFFGSTTGESTGGVKEAAKEVVKQTIDNTVEKAKEKGREEAEIQAARLVKEAEEKGQALRDEASKAAESIRKEADLQAQKLIDGAASKGTIAKMAAQKGAETIKKTADKKATQVIQEADVQANKLVEEAKVKSDELLKKI
jgi:vacuolar-type H+-ATPase subunit H